MNWRPQTLLELPEEAEALRKDKHGRIICPNCGSHRHPVVIVDVRSLPIPESFACDCCWTKWERQGRDVTGTGDATSRKDWRARWVSALGGPQEIVDKIRGKPS